MNTRSETIPSLWKNRIFQQLFWAHGLSLIGSGLSSLALGLLAHQLVGASASSVLGVTLAIWIIVLVAHRTCHLADGKVAGAFPNGAPPTLIDSTSPCPSAAGSMRNCRSISRKE